MHSVTVLNVLRQRALPNVDFRNPSEVLANLNDMFQMDSHNGLLFTIVVPACIALTSAC